MLYDDLVTLQQPGQFSLPEPCRIAFRYNHHRPVSAGIAKEYLLGKSGTVRIFMVKGLKDIDLVSLIEKCIIGDFRDSGSGKGLQASPPGSWFSFRRMSA